MRFLMVDRIEEIVPAKEIKASKLITGDDPFACDPVSGEPGLWEGIAVEALCQAGAWLIMHSTEFRQRAVLLGAEQIVIHGRAVPGDVLQLHGELHSLDGQSAVFSGKGYVNGACMLELHYMMCALIPVEELEATEDVKRTFRLLRREISG
ncbi:hypothetical protein [Brevibacillus fulvus]|uniref:3-hydroxyacyl-[acyl-carrier-protein] dehydratase n=1 Tax=Brevibacillus fulvus TaxID=1125967 RepID=A0A938Y1Q2_9BACL|nr:hypothetical protein [Brevibacillus fulvus]MBM7589555.1 3-hydroxyacyl-[acyl-carrier-protein] dehydratase [Brevibacillus fulvus]